MYLLQSLFSIITVVPFTFHYYGGIIAKPIFYKLSKISSKISLKIKSIYWNLAFRKSI